MGRPNLKPSGVRSRAAAVRFREEEWDGLKQLAENLGETPSRIIRRLVREALTGGPDYFDDGVIDLRNMHRELNAIGRNLNQLTRAVNQGQVLNGDDVRGVINAAVVQMEAVKALYGRAVKTTVKRAVWPLYQASGLPLPQTETGKEQAEAGKEQGKAAEK